jgi:hypothetical protein
MIAGTPSYVAPEQAQGEGLDARADQYSLASLTYLLLTGRPAYSHASLTAAASPGPPPPLSTPERAFPAGVEAVVARGLAPDRDERWPDVNAFVTALGSALDGASPGGREATAPGAWLPVDPHLTQPGAAPTPRPPSRDLPEPAPTRPGRRRALAVVAAVVVLAAGAAAGFGLEQRTEREATLSDAQGNLSVTVPDGWDRAAADEGWTPPNERTDFPALSVGTSRDWTRTDAGGQGVFLGILPGTELPSQVPRHPECEAAQQPVDDIVDGNASVTVVYSGCPGGVTVERVVQVAENLLLWVQVRSADRATANRVLDAVETHGM